MKRSKIFLATGTFVLAIASVFATKANKRFTAFNTAYVSGLGNVYIHVAAHSGISFFTTAGSAGLSVNLYTTGINKTSLISGTMVSANDGTIDLHYNTAY